MRHAFLTAFLLSFALPSRAVALSFRALGVAEVDLSKPLIVRKEPQEKSVEVARITEWSQIENSEFKNGVPAAIVYGDDDGWLLIRTRAFDRDVWGYIPPARAVFTPLEKLLQGRVYLTDSWNRVLIRDLKKESAPLKYSGDLEDIQVRVLETDGAQSDVWVKIEILEDESRLGVQTVNKFTSGWIPAYTPDGVPNIWFYPPK